MKTAKQADFFLGANTPDGFFSFFSQLNDPDRVAHCYLIKGCAGSGKSTMMKTLADRMIGQESLIERIHCSSDPDSLDGVILQDSQTVIADATPPHVIEPQLPAVYEQVVSLYDCFDPADLSGMQQQGMLLNQQIRACHARCCSYLAGGAMLLEENHRIAAESTDYQKVITQAKRLAQKEMPKKKGGVGREHKRMLSAFTPQGNIAFPQTVSALCDRVYLIKDEYAAASRVMLHTLKEEALARGYDLFCCYCPLGVNKPEHLLIPELGLGFVTQNSYLTYPGEVYRVIHAARFTDKAKLKLKKQRLRFHKRAARELLQEAVRAVAAAKEYHDALEQIYRKGVSFDRVEKAQERLYQEIAARYR